MTTLDHLDACQLGALVTATLPIAPPPMRQAVFVKVTERFFQRTIAGQPVGSPIRAGQLATVLDGGLYRDVVIDGSPLDPHT